MAAQSIDTEICIVGAGPAGATTSLFLAKMGIPHLILDAAVFPRDKVCGDGLDLKVIRVLRHLDPAIIDEIAANQAFSPSWGARFITPNGRQSDYVYRPRTGEPQYPLFWVAKRLCFDDFLVKKLDFRFANFHPGTPVTQVIRDGNRWRLLAKGPGGDLEIRTSLLIGADGDHSAVLRGLGERKIDRRHYAGTLRQYWKGVEGIHPLNLIEVYFPPGLPLSYFYVFPLPGGDANVGYGMVSEVAARGQHRLRDLFQELILHDPVLAPRFRHAEPLDAPAGWGLPLASRRRRACGNGYLLVGDAASLICPTTGEGIGSAMMSGFIAAHFARKALTAKRFDATVFAGYETEIYRRLNTEIRQYEILRRYLPWQWYERGLNALVPTTLLRTFFQNQAGNWLRTAYERPIEIDFGRH